MIFIKVKAPTRTVTKENTVKKITRFFLGLIVPKANPDFENKIQLVAFWLLEFTSQNSTPQREIGLGKDIEVILKMPYNKNYGYWVDNNLTFEDFQKSFEVEYITKEYFEEIWDRV